MFWKRYRINLQSREKKKISDIQVGDILQDGSKVTAWMELSVRGEQIYKYNDIIVTGNHRIYDEEKGYIEVKCHPTSCLYNDYNNHLVYCINTDTKKICIDNTTFLDWDDLDEMTMTDIKKTAKIYYMVSLKLKIFMRI